MDVIVLVGGQGTRLMPLTAHRHKSLVPVANRPAIAHLLDWLERSRFKRAILAIGTGNGDLAQACPPGTRGGMEIVHVVETHRLESGGAIRNAVVEAGIEGRFAVVNGDIIVDFDFGDALAAHGAARAELTLALTPVEDTSAFGVAVVGPDGLITRFVEKPAPGTAPGNLVNAGVWIFEAGLVGEILPGAVRVEDTLFPGLVNHARRVLGYVFEGLWTDIGIPERYRALNVRLAREAGGAIVGPGAVCEGAIVENSVIGAGVTLAPGASIRESVLWENVRVGAGAVVEGSVLADGTEIGAGVHLRDAVAGAGVSVEPGAGVPAGSVLEAGARYHREHGY